jgi:hypothetical protein
MFKIFYGIMLAIFLYIAGSSIYTSMTKKELKSSRISCQKKTLTFETFRKPSLIPKAIEMLKSGNYKLDSEIRFSKFMQSKLGKYLKVKDVDKMLNETISKHLSDKRTKDKELIIKYFVYENDKDDPGKKTAKSKLYAGYIYLDFKLDNESVYDVQIDYKDLEAKDLNKTIECAINSFLSAGKS